MGRSRKPLCGQPYRGFESLSLRQPPSLIHSPAGAARTNVDPVARLELVAANTPTGDSIVSMIEHRKAA